MTLIDVAIIGGGASGTTTAFHLASKSKNVCILEKNVSSLERICGGGMSAAVQDWFPFKLLPIVDDLKSNKNNILAKIPNKEKDRVLGLLTKNPNLMTRQYQGYINT